MAEHRIVVPGVVGSTPITHPTDIHRLFEAGIFLRQYNCQHFSTYVNLVVKRISSLYQAYIKCIREYA